MSITSNRKNIISRVSVGLVTAAAAATILGACAPTGHSSTAAANATQASEQAVQKFSDSLPNTPMFNAFKQGLFNATHNPLGPA
jgi:hypothetical protein